MRVACWGCVQLWQSRSRSAPIRVDLSSPHWSANRVTLCSSFLPSSPMSFRLVCPHCDFRRSAFRSGPMRWRSAKRREWHRSQRARKGGGRDPTRRQHLELSRATALFRPSLLEVRRAHRTAAILPCCCPVPSTPRWRPLIICGRTTPRQARWWHSSCYRSSRSHCASRSEGGLVCTQRAKTEKECSERVDQSKTTTGETYNERASDKQDSSCRVVVCLLCDPQRNSGPFRCREVSSTDHSKALTLGCAQWPELHSLAACLLLCSDEATVQVLQPDGRVLSQPAPIHSSQLNWSLRPMNRFAAHFLQGLVFILTLSAMSDNRVSGGHTRSRVQTPPSLPWSVVADLSCARVRVLCVPVGCE